MTNKTVKNINLVRENLQQAIFDNNLVVSKEDLSYLFNFCEKNKKRVETLILEDEFVGQSYHNIIFIEDLTRPYVKQRKFSS